MWKCPTLSDNSMVSSVSPSSSWISPWVRAAFTTWSMTGHVFLSHSGYVSIYDIEIEYSVTVSFRRVTLGGCTHVPVPILVFILFFCLALCCVCGSLPLILIFLCWEICRNVLFTALKKSHIILFLVSSSLYLSLPSSSCNILVFTVVFPLWDRKSVV